MEDGTTTLTALVELGLAITVFGLFVAGFAKLNLREPTWWPAVGLIIASLLLAVVAGSL